MRRKITNSPSLISENLATTPSMILSSSGLMELRGDWPPMMLDSWRCSVLPPHQNHERRVERMAPMLNCVCLDGTEEPRCVNVDFEKKFSATFGGVKGIGRQKVCDILNSNQVHRFGCIYGEKIGLANQRLSGRLYLTN